MKIEYDKKDKVTIVTITTFTAKELIEVMERIEIDYGWELEFEEFLREICDDFWCYYSRTEEFIDDNTCVIRLSIPLKESTPTNLLTNYIKN